jgi:tetratricopeptide (TPR) repeat protein
MAELMGSEPPVTRDLLAMGVQKPSDILGWYVAGPDQLDAMGGDAPVNHVQYPVLEFTAPKAITIRGVSRTMPALLTAVQQLPEPLVWAQLNSMCTKPLDGSTLRDAVVARLAGIWLMRGQLEYSYESYNQYLQAAMQAHTLRPQDNFVRQMLADALWSVGTRQDDNGSPQEAYSSYREAYVNDPTRADAICSAAYAALEMGNLDLAEQTLALASPEQRGYFQVLVYQGMTALRRLNYDAAATYLRKAAAGDQESPTLDIGLALVSLKRGHRKEAHQLFHRAIEISTRGLDTLYNIVDLCRTHGFTGDARQYAQMLADVASDNIAADAGRPNWYNYRALAYSALGEDQKAKRDEAAARSLSYSSWYGATENAPSVLPVN